MSHLGAGHCLKTPNNLEIGCDTLSESVEVAGHKLSGSLELQRVYDFFFSSI